MRILRAIIAGERDPRRSGCVIHGAKAEHLFALEQALAIYDHIKERIAACDVRIESPLKKPASLRDPRKRHRRPRAGACLDKRTPLHLILEKRFMLCWEGSDPNPPPRGLPRIEACR
jgi:transposase